MIILRQKSAFPSIIKQCLVDRPISTLRLSAQNIGLFLISDTPVNVDNRLFSHRSLESLHEVSSKRTTGTWDPRRGKMKEMLRIQLSPTCCSAFLITVERTIWEKEMRDNTGSYSCPTLVILHHTSDVLSYETNRTMTNTTNFVNTAHIFVVRSQLPVRILTINHPIHYVVNLVYPWCTENHGCFC